MRQFGPSREVEHVQDNLKNANKMMYDYLGHQKFCYNKVVKKL